MGGKPKIFQFLIIPLLLIVFIAVALNELTHFYFEWYDPVYAYLMNGLTFALGSGDIGHTDHPGTPLQLFCSVVIRVVHFFRN
jgi:subtilase family serine protease